VWMGWQSIQIVGVSACVIFILLQKIQKMAKCTFWYRLIRVVPDKVHRAVKWLCVCVLSGGDGVFVIVDARHTRQGRHEPDTAGNVQLTGQLRRHETVRYVCSHSPFALLGFLGPHFQKFLGTHTQPFYCSSGICPGPPG